MPTIKRNKRLWSSLINSELVKTKISDKLFILWRVRDFLHRSTLWYVDWNSKQCQILSQLCDVTGPSSPFPWRSSQPRKFDEKMTKFKTQNHLYHSKALEKRYRELLSEYSRFLNITRENSFWRPKNVISSLFLSFFDVKNHKKVPFWRLRNEFPRVRLRNRLYPLKSLIYRFSRAFEIYKWLRVLKFVLFCQFFGVYCLGNGKNRPVTSQGCDKIWHCLEFQSMYHRVLLCKNSQTLHKMKKKSLTSLLFKGTKPDKK